MACIHSLPATSPAKLKSALKMQEGDSAYFFNRSKKGSLLLPRIENEVHFRVKWCWVTQGDVEAETSLSLIEKCSDGSASIFDFQVGRDRQLSVGQTPSTPIPLLQKEDMRAVGHFTFLVLPRRGGSSQ